MFSMLLTIFLIYLLEIRKKTLAGLRELQKMVK